MKDERTVAILILILTKNIKSRKELSNYLNCSTATVSRSLSSIKCCFSDYFNNSFDLIFKNNCYQIVSYNFNNEMLINKINEIISLK